VNSMPTRQLSNQANRRQQRCWPHCAACTPTHTLCIAWHRSRGRWWPGGSPGAVVAVRRADALFDTHCKQQLASPPVHTTAKWTATSALTLQTAGIGFACEPHSPGGSKPQHFPKMPHGSTSSRRGLRKGGGRDTRSGSGAKAACFTSEVHLQASAPVLPRSRPSRSPVLL